MTIGYQLQGHPDSPRVVFLHGFWGDRRSFAGIVERLGDRIYALSLDLPGHGQTSIGANCSMATVAAQIVALLDQLGFWPCTIVGYSMGGRLALSIALTLPDPTGLTGLILESASPGLADPIARADRRVRDEIWARRLELEPIDRVLDDWYRQPMFSSLVQHRSFQQLRSQRLTQNGPNLARAMRGLGLGQQPNLWPQLPQITTKTLLIVGDRDPKFIAINQQMRALNPGTIDLQILANCGHNSNTESPDIYTIALKSWLF